VASAVIIDDDRGMRLLASMVADEVGCRVVAEAETGELGVALTLRRRPDVVVMDYRLPGIDGAEATEEIKRELPSARVVGWTSSDDQSARERLLAAGAEDVVDKRELDRLRQVLRAWCAEA